MTPEQAELHRRQLERWADPATAVDAQRRADESMQTFKQRVPRLMELDAHLQRAKKPQHKIYWLRQIADTWASTFAAHAACRDGCSACCYQPVLITEGEAQAIAKDIGVPAVTPPVWRDDAWAPYIGTPCTFLKDNRCSIYASRPIACRTHFNLDADALLCTIIPGSGGVQLPLADASPIHQRYIFSQAPADMTAARAEGVTAMHMADIRDFFPPK